MEIAGHRDLATTQGYGHTAPNHLQRTRAILGGEVRTEMRTAPEKEAGNGPSKGEETTQAEAPKVTEIGPSCEDEGKPQDPPGMRNAGPSICRQDRPPGVSAP